jgi:hypothetical protein
MTWFGAEGSNKIIHRAIGIFRANSCIFGHHAATVRKLRTCYALFLASTAVYEICALVGFHAAQKCGFLATFWDNLSVPSSKVQQGFLEYSKLCASQKSADLKFVLCI